ncbi:Tad domain-containing protein [Desulfovibrio ferrophilus]|uniref:Tad domain-containing protein n=1 Tax=Desulfovibrio ferrophilus TaxID=241368 RepID=UPI001E40ECF3|nr:Tad domain-containing protein [Desulfovibrio ferrophilus]
MAAAIPTLVGLAGLGLDSALLYQAHGRLQSAVDSAALAGSLELPYDPDMTKGIVEAAAVEYLEKNYPEAQLKSLGSGTEARSVTVEGEAVVDLLLLDALGLSDTVITAKATAGFNNLEIVFVIDNSGSMKGAPITETNEASVNLVNLIMPAGMESSVKVGLVPFRGKVRIPANVDGLPAGCRNADGTFNWDLDEEYYKTEYRYPVGSYLRVSSGTCSGIPETQGLTHDRSSIVTAIEDQDARGTASGTVISEGLKWARHVLTPEAPFTEGSDKDDMRKIIILLTDGDTEDGMCGGNYDVSYTPNVYWTNAYYGMLDMESHCDNGGVLNQAMLDEAQLAKDAGIEIFAVRYGNSDSTDVTLMKQVASSKAGTDDHFYDAPSPYDIDDIFKKIGRQLGWRLLN